MRTRTRVLCSASILATLLAAPAFAQTTPASPPQDPATGEETQVDDVVVTGLRRSLQSAQSIRRNSDQIVDAIVAEDIGKLPDTTASDSLARVTGVQVERSGGEAGRVLVRGLPDITTTYNGRDIFTAEARFVAVQDFPAGGVAALEVFKSTTANQLEGGIAGLINVRSRRPFDFADREIAGSIRGTYASQSREYDPNFNLLLSDRWETGAGEFGALINVSYTQLQYLDSARFNGGWIEDADPGQVANPALTGFRYPDAVGIFYGQARRSRPSMNAAFQWRPSENLELYADVLYQGFRNEVEDRRLLVPLYGGPTFSNVVLQPGTNQAQSLTSTGGARPWMFTGATEGETDTWQYGIGAVYTHGPWRISTDLAHTDSVFDLSVLSADTEFNTNPTVNVNFDVPEEDGGVEFSFPTFDTTDPANFIYLGIFDRRLQAAGDDIQWRGDIEYETGAGFITQVDFGLRFSDRNGSFEEGARFGFAGVPLTSTPLDLFVLPGGFRGSDVQQTRTWVSATRDSIRENIDALRTFGGLSTGEPGLDPFLTFEANEKSSAAYVQAHYAFGDTFPVDGVIGLRAVKTELEMDGTVRNGGIFTPRSVETEYTDYLPSISARIALREDLQLRLAANKTRTRPNFNQLNPTINVDPFPDNGAFNAFGGNPDLQPLEADNYDAALEYYFSSTGSLIVSFFQRDVSGFIQNRVETVNDPDFALPLRINRPINLADATLKGMEAQFTTFFDFDGIPDWARNFGVQANLTLIEQTGDLNGISDTSANLVGMYESGSVSARLAYNYRSDFRNFCETNGLMGSGCEYTDAVSRLDFSVSWTPIESITLTFDASNILGEPFRNYRDYNDNGGPTMGTFVRDVRFEESIYSLGLRFRY
jgi:iron complex outermembrane receptor protein